MTVFCMRWPDHYRKRQVTANAHWLLTRYSVVKEPGSPSDTRKRAQEKGLAV